MTPSALARGAVAGALHGVAEWLPVSSSGHVALLIDVAGWPEGDPAKRRERRALEVALHTGSLVPVGARVLRDLRAAERPAASIRAGMIATGVTAVVGGIAGPLVEERFAGPRSVAVGLVAGSAALVAAERRAARLTRSGVERPGSASARQGDLLPEGRGGTELVGPDGLTRGMSPMSGERPLPAVGLADAVAIGIAQGLAIWPGVSRRAATLAAARARGFDPAAAGALSWVVGLPTLAAATSWQFWRSRDDLRRASAGPAAGAATSVALGLLSRALPDRTARWPATAWAAWRVALAAATLRRSPAG